MLPLKALLCASKFSRCHVHLPQMFQCCQKCGSYIYEHPRRPKRTLRRMTPTILPCLLELFLQLGNLLLQITQPRLADLLDGKKNRDGDAQLLCITREGRETALLW